VRFLQVLDSNDRIRDAPFDNGHRDTVSLGRPHSPLVQARQLVAGSKI
jgi:hypothetical protein